MNSDLDLAKIMTSDIYKQLKLHKLIDEIELRNIQIRSDYDALRTNHHVSACIDILTEKYCLAWDTLRNIIFRK